MNEFILSIIIAVALGFVSGVVACLAYLVSQVEEESPETKPQVPSPTYSEEEIALAKFLEDKQAVNEAYLSAQAELLKEFRK